MTSRNRLSLLVLASLLTACAEAEPVATDKPRDMAQQGGADLGVPSLDLSGSPGPVDLGPDLTSVPDMARPWADRSVAPAIASGFFGVWSNGNGTVWAVGGNGSIYKSTGGAAFTADATRPSGTPNLFSISSTGNGPPNSAMYVGGAGGALWRNGGASWSVDASGTANTVFGVWVAPDDNLFMVGSGGFARKKLGGTFTTLTGIPSTEVAYNVWGWKTATGYSVYAVGSNGKIWHHVTTGTAGSTFVGETSGVTTDLIGVYGFSATDIYVVGAGGVVLHSTGTGTWTKQTTPATTDLEGVGGASADEVYAVGVSGTVLRKLGVATTTWTREVLPNASETRNMLGVWASTTDVYVVGEAGAILKK